MAGLTNSPRILRLLGIAVVLLTISGVTVVWVRQAPRALTVDDALAEFRGQGAADGATTPDIDVAGTAQPAPPNPDGATAAPPASTAPVTPAPPGETTQAPPPAATSVPGAATPAPGAALAPPEEGVYTFRTQGGGETDALGGARHDYPEQVALVVRRGGCGYTVRWQPLAERWDEWEFCPDGARRPMARISTYHEFFKRGQRQDFDCGRAEMQPADRTPGRRWTWGCRSADGAVRSTTTLVGVEMLDLGGTAVRTVRYRHDVVFTGANEGSQVFEWWLHADSGLPLRLERNLKVKATTPFGRANYTEQFTSQAISPAPRR